MSAPAAAVPSAPASTAAAGVAGEVSVVEARDRAVRTRLQRGAATFDELLAVLPPDPTTPTDTARREALSRCVSRLRLKREIRSVHDRWELTA